MNTAFLDVLQYPPDLLVRYKDCISVQVIYRKSWDDGFGVGQILAPARTTGIRRLPQMRLPGARLPAGAMYVMLP